MSKPLRYAGVFALVAVALIILFPTLGTGLWADDYIFLERAGRMDLFQYLSRCCDLRFPDDFRRPAFGVLLWIQYFLLGSNATGYHLISVAFHIANSAMIWILVSKIAGSQRLGLVAGLLFAGLTLNDFVILWISNDQELAVTFLYWLAVFYWLTYLKQGGRMWFLLTILAGVTALAFKETAISLPITLFLLDRLIVRRQVKVTDLIRRYAVFGMVLILYLFQYLAVIKLLLTGRTANTGSGIAANLLRYLVALLAPFPTEIFLNNIWLWGFALLVLTRLVYLIIKTGSRALAFLVLEVFVTLIPFLPFFSLRYLYITSSVAVVLWALVVVRLGRWSGFVLVLVLVANGLIMNESSRKYAELVRSDRIPFRDISQRHPTVARDTLFYLIDAPIPMPYLSGMFFFRYGKDVTVEDPNNGRAARWRDYDEAYVYFFDEPERLIEVRVQRDSPAQTALPLPLDYAVPIRFEGFEASSAQLRRGEEFALLLYWRARGQIDKDYTVFVHLVNASGEIVVSEDSQPRGGRAPTTSWRSGDLIVDPHKVWLPPDLPRGSYHLEIGTYFLPTLERLQFVDENRRVVADKVVIESFVVE